MAARGLLFLFFFILTVFVLSICFRLLAVFGHSGSSVNKILY